MTSHESLWTGKQYLSIAQPVQASTLFHCIQGQEGNRYHCVGPIYYHFPLGLGQVWHTGSRQKRGQFSWIQAVPQTGIEPREPEPKLSQHPGRTCGQAFRTTCRCFHTASPVTSARIWQLPPRWCALFLKVEKMTLGFLVVPSFQARFPNSQGLWVFEAWMVCGVAGEGRSNMLDVPSMHTRRSLVFIGVFAPHDPAPPNALRWASLAPRHHCIGHGHAKYELPS